MRAYLVALGLFIVIAVVPTLTDAQGCIPGTANCSSASAVSSSEPLALWLTGFALIGASLLRRRQ